MTETINSESRKNFLAQLDKYNSLYEQHALDQTLLMFFVADYLVESNDVDVLELIPDWLVTKLEELSDVYKRDGELTLSGSHGVTDKSGLGRRLTELLNR